MQKKKTVFVGLSGGVDSSVTAALLLEQGYTVVGVYIRTWQPDFIECTAKEDRLDAMRTAAHLGIPFLECDAEEEYKKSVADYMIAEYRAGRTPNPDVMCNREIKFGVFLSFAMNRGADYIATGHYARVLETPDGFSLATGVDVGKDQSYFLYRLTNTDLERVLFPLGGYVKSDVRELAKKFKLPTAAKKDSQGVCMLGDLDIKQFLAHYIEPKRGEVLGEDGAVVGYHDGAVFLTLGERHGFTITTKTPNDAPYYIIAKDVEKNTVTVSQKNTEGENSVLSRKDFTLSNVSWVREVPTIGKTYSAQIRYHGEYLPCSIVSNDNRDAVVQFETPVLVASGQSIVLYEGEVCLGGGIVV